MGEIVAGPGNILVFTKSGEVQQAALTRSELYDGSGSRW
ncbi:hypothetical protein FB471_3998 [Amycolatopsis cihanbeyliensis]|uniref:Uncharacterized protein n=1 Tax=Amycolatopsis cihanbeyliensis TaxID=1128664 RepID=A0A542DMJ9_AMYCI|nr:hypothetical protein FB471_3998 [Amycolatopsis cihanbeyliensis]